MWDWKTEYPCQQITPQFNILYVAFQSFLFPVIMKSSSAMIFRKNTWIRTLTVGYSFLFFKPGFMPDACTSSLRVMYSCVCICSFCSYTDIEHLYTFGLTWLHQSGQSSWLRFWARLVEWWKEQSRPLDPILLPCHFGWPTHLSCFTSLRQTDISLHTLLMPRTSLQNVYRSERA